MRSRIAAMFLQLISGERDLISAGIAFAASPMISSWRTTALFVFSSFIKAFLSIPAVKSFTVRAAEIISERYKKGDLILIQAPLIHRPSQVVRQLLGVINEIPFFRFKGFRYLVFHVFLSKIELSDNLFKVGWPSAI